MSGKELIKRIRELLNKGFSEEEIYNILLIEDLKKEECKINADELAEKYSVEILEEALRIIEKKNN